jgi:hypothetical protein
MAFTAWPLAVAPKPEAHLEPFAIKRSLKI